MSSYQRYQHQGGDEDTEADEEEVMSHPEVDVRGNTDVSIAEETFTVLPEGSKRRKPLLLGPGGHSYSMKRELKNSKNWRCSFRERNHPCPATVVEKEGRFTPGKHRHTHDGRPNLLLQKAVRRQLQAKVSEEEHKHKPASQLVKEVMLDFPLKGKEKVLSVPAEVRAANRKRAGNQLKHTKTCDMERDAASLNRRTVTVDTHSPPLGLELLSSPGLQTQRDAASFNRCTVTVGPHSPLREFDLDQLLQTTTRPQQDAASLNGSTVTVDTHSPPRGLELLSSPVLQTTTRPQKDAASLNRRTVTVGTHSPPRGLELLSSPVLQTQRQAVDYTFHDNHGEHITLSADRRTATCTGSRCYAGLVVSREPLAANVLYEVRLDEWETHNAVLAVGVLTVSPDSVDLTYTWSGRLSHATAVSTVGVKLTGDVGWVDHPLKSAMKGLRRGDRVGVSVDTSRRLHLHVNGNDRGVWGNAGTGGPCHALIAIVFCDEGDHVTVCPPTRLE